MEKKIVDKIKDLKRGDTVVVYNSFNNHLSPFVETVKSITKKSVTTTTNLYISRFDLMGNGDYGWKLFPGNMEEYNRWVETKNIAKNIYNDLFDKIYRLSREELAIIEKMISE